jgi:hypothetical protein
MGVGGTSAWPYLTSPRLKSGQGAHLGDSDGAPNPTLTPTRIGGNTSAIAIWLGFVRPMMMVWTNM